MLLIDRFHIAGGFCIGTQASEPGASGALVIAGKVFQLFAGHALAQAGTREQAAAVGIAAVHIEQK